MEHHKHIFLFIFFVSMFFLGVDIVTTSRVITEKRVETDSKVRVRNTDVTTTSMRHRRRSIQEHGKVRHHVDICGDIIGSKWKIPKQGKSPCPKLVVWVPKKTGFTDFVKVNQLNEVEGGFSIAVFCHALHLLPFNVKPIFTPFINNKGESNGTYDQMLRHIEGKTCEAVGADVTVRASRTPYVRFTSPYMSSDVYMLVRASHEWNQTLWTFLRPFTWRLWITIVGVCIYIGLAVAILEYRIGNPRFIVPIHHRAVMVIWFPISTFFFHEGRILNKSSKAVLIMWLIMIFIIVQIFTASLSAWLTIDQMRPKLPSGFENVGYQDGSFLREFIIQKYNCSGKNLLPLKSFEEYKNALFNGSVDVVFDDLPYIELFLAKHGSSYMKSGPINQESGIAFAFPHGSPLFEDFSRAVINVTESDAMMQMKKKYLGFRVLDGSQPDQPLPQSLDVQSFIGLIIFIGTFTIAAIVYSEIFLRRIN